MNLKKIFERLEIEPYNSINYFHISLDALKPIAGIRDIFDCLEQYFSNKSTVCMPSFPFTGANYTDYVDQDPVFNVRTTPSRVNLMCEVFRRKQDVIRSVHPWCSVACKGPAAADLISDHHLDHRPFGPLSPFWKIMSNQGKVIGLGVDCNTNSFAHMPDDRMSEYYNFPVYEETPRRLRCIDYQGQLINVDTNIVARGISKKIKPRNMKGLFQEQSFYKEFQIQNIYFYSMNILKFVEFSITSNTDMVEKKGKPLYYS